MITKDKINEFLKEVEVDDLLQNLQIMGKTVYLTMKAHSPALHERRKLEVAMKSAFENRFGAEWLLDLKITSPEVGQMPAITAKKLKNIKNIIAIASGKGGVGKSTVAANIAVTLAQMGFSVGLLDADIYGPSVPTMFDCEHKKPQSVVFEGKNKMQPIENHGVKMLSIGFFSGVHQAVVWRGPMASKALHQMIHDAHWGELDFLILDLPPGTGDIHLSILQEVPVTGAVIVSTPQKIALADVQRGIALFQMESVNVPVLGIIENMAYFSPDELPDKKYYIFGKQGAQKLAEQLDLPLLGELPLVAQIREGADAGRPAALDQESAIGKAYQNVAKKTLASLIQRNENLPATEQVRITTISGCAAK